MEENISKFTYMQIGRIYKVYCEIKMATESHTNKYLMHTQYNAVFPLIITLTQKSSLLLYFSYFIIQIILLLKVLTKIKFTLNSILSKYSDWLF